MARSLARIAARRNLEVVLLPIGWCHGDLDEGRPETRGRPAKSRGEIPLELYTTIAELHARLEDETAARRATEKELRDSKEFLRDRHLAHKARLKRWEDRNERLEAEVWTLRAQNESP